MNDRTRAIICVKSLSEYCLGERELTDSAINVAGEIIKMEGEKSFFFFSKHVLGFDLLTEQTHEKWADDIQNDFLKWGKIMRLKPRGTYKTSLYGISFILWLWCHISTELKIFYTSSSDLLITEVSTKLDNYIDNDNLNVFQIVYGIRRDLDAQKNTNDIFNIVGGSSQGHSLILRTAGSSTNGIHPHVVIVDDPMDRRDRTSKAIRDGKSLWFDSITPLLVPFKYKDKIIKLLMVISTRWHMKDLINYILEINKRLRDEKKWSIEVESIYKNDNINEGSNYPELFSDLDIQDLKDSMDELFFSCQYRNLPLPQGSLIFDENKLHLIGYDDVNFMEGKISCFFDPAEGVEKGDYPAPVWVLNDNITLTLIDVIDKKIDLEELLIIIAAKNKHYNVAYMQLESNGTTLLKSTMDRLHKEIGHYCYVEDVHRPSTSNKDNRIVSMQPELYSGYMRFIDSLVKKHSEMWDQIIMYPAYGNDDYPDVIETAISHFKRGGEFEFIRYEGVS